MNQNEMLNCHECSFGKLSNKQKPCDMCGIQREIKLQMDLMILCEDNEQIIISPSGLNYLKIDYIKNNKCITLTALKNNLTDDKIEDIAIDLMDQFKKLYKED